MCDTLIPEVLKSCEINTACILRIYRKFDRTYEFLID